MEYHRDGVKSLTALIEDVFKMQIEVFIKSVINIRKSHIISKVDMNLKYFTPFNTEQDDFTKPIPLW